MNDLFALHNNQININANEDNKKNEETDNNNDNKDLNETQGFLF